MFNLLDLFSGIGGFSLGLERTQGFKTVAFCEIDPFCRKVLKKHWPEVPCYEDIITLTGGALSRDGIKINAICGGFPCQDISTAGKGAGMAGARSGLWSHYARLIGELRPKYVIVENVAALLGRGLDRVCGDLAALRYDAEWHCIPASAVGADHRRDRIWIIAYPDSAGTAQHQECGRKQRQAQMGEDAATGNADADSTRLPWRLSSRAIREDARNISARLGLALSSAAAFPGLDGAGSPVLGRGEDGIPDRMDRLCGLGNAVVPQIPEIIGNAILEAEKEIVKG